MKIFWEEMIVLLLISQSDSNTQSPVDEILHKMLEISKNAAILLPPFINTNELKHLPEHECESLYINKNHAHYGLFFANLSDTSNETKYCVNI